MSKAFTRRSTPFGHFISPKGTPKRFQEYSAQLHIREMNFGLGGIGAGIWDASIIISHFILKNPHIFTGKTVHEVGAGIGLPALYSSFFSKHTISSDYLTPLVDNFEYNVKCNYNTLSTGNDYNDNTFSTTLEEDYSTASKAYHQHPLWDLIYTNQKSIEKRIDDEEKGIFSTQPDIDYPIVDIHQCESARLQKLHEEELDTQSAVATAEEPDHLNLNYHRNHGTSAAITSAGYQSTLPNLTLSYNETASSLFPQTINDLQSITTIPASPTSSVLQLTTSPSPPRSYFPVNCLNHSSTCGCLGYAQPSNFSQLTPQTNLPNILTHRKQCLRNMARSAQSILLDWFQFNSMPNSLKKSLNCDIILGSEVCYPTILDALPSLAAIISQTLSDTGVFYLVQSPNRGTSLHFIEELCRIHGFLLHLREVPEIELTSFRSGQREERYVYYTFARPNSIFPIMGLGSDIVSPPDGLSPESMALINPYTKKHLPNGTIVDCDVVFFSAKLAEPLPP